MVVGGSVAPPVILTGLIAGVVLVFLSYFQPGVLHRLGLHFFFFFDISVSLSNFSRGSWGRSPCSDPSWAGDISRSWCRDHGGIPYDGAHSFGFALLITY